MSCGASARAGSTSGVLSVSRNDRAPEGQCSIIAIMAERATESAAPSPLAIFHTFVALLLQKPAWAHSDRSSRTTTPPPSIVLARSA